jgi:hypothetical protein
MMASMNGGSYNNQY